MKKRLLIGTLAVSMASASASAFSYQINGVYAQLIDCTFAYSAVRGESGYTGTYKALSETFTVYFGSSYCPS